MTITGDADAPHARAPPGPGRASTSASFITEMQRLDPDTPFLVEHLDPTRSTSPPSPTSAPWPTSSGSGPEPHTGDARNAGRGVADVELVAAARVEGELARRRARRGPVGDAHRRDPGALGCGAMLGTIGPAARGRRLSIAEDAFGWLRASDDVAEDPAALRERLTQDGYLFVPGLLDRGRSRPGARSCSREPGCADYPMPSDAMRRRPRPAHHRLLHRLLGTEVRSYDFIWLRHQPPGHGIPPHCDPVFMGRGTPDVLTAWIPFGDIPIRGAA